VAAPVTKNCEATEAAQTGWSGTETVAASDHPVRSNKVASRQFLDVASTPPHEEGTARTKTRSEFIHSLIDRSLLMAHGVDHEIEPKAIGLTR